MIDHLTIRRPDDWHVHLRDGAMLRAVLPWTAATFARAIVMPNLMPPITTADAARAYRDRILAALPNGADFAPLMTCYLTDTTNPDDLAAGHADGIWLAAKLYPAGATTNAHHGVTDIARIHPVLARMERIGMTLLIHGEATDPEIDIFDREAVFLERTLAPLRAAHPALRIVLEHVTTEDAVAFVRAHAGAGNTAATITPHHLVINRTSIFQGGIRPHLYCLPIAKRERHRLALRAAATSGEGCFFLGTDTAPHVVGAKESACGCAGCFVAPVALATYAQVFDEEAALDRLEAFASLNGAAFHRVPPNETRITLRRTLRRTPNPGATNHGTPSPGAPHQAPACIDVDGDQVVVFRGGETPAWTVDPPSNRY